MPMLAVVSTEAAAEDDCPNDQCADVKRTSMQRRFKIAKNRWISRLGYNAGPRRCALLSRMSVAHLLNQQSIGYRRELARLGDCTNGPEHCPYLAHTLSHNHDDLGKRGKRCGMLTPFKSRCRLKKWLTI